MRRARLMPLAAIACLLLLAASAFAASQTVRGQGDLKKMVADNGSKTLTVKLFGFKGPCQAKQFDITIMWATKPAYDVQAACTAGTTWNRALYYAADRSQGFGTKKVSCRGFKLTYASAGSVWTAVIPRTCISKAANRIRVKAEGINYSGSAMPGIAGPTRLLARG